MRTLFRILAIGVVALLSGPRVGLAVDGEWTVICDGETGAPTLALYDFETGDVVEPVLVIETCGFCYLADTAASPRAPFSGATPVLLSYGVAAPDVAANRSPLRMADARAPPTFVKA